jgi:hypothetical protein
MIRVDDLIADLCELPARVIVGKKKRKEFQVRHAALAEKTRQPVRRAM